MGWSSGSGITTHGPSSHTNSIKPTASTYEVMPRWMRTSDASAPTSGRLQMVAIELPSAAVITSITFVSGATAAVLPTNQWFALYDSSRNLLRQTTDDTTTAWAANALKTLNLTSTYTITATGLYYLGIMVAATTTPSLSGANTNAVITGIAPIICGTSTTGLTDTAPNPAAALTGLAFCYYAYVS